MPVAQPSGWGAEIDRILGGGLPDSTEDRLERLRRWGGSTSYLSVGAETATRELGLEPIAQVVGAAGGQSLLGIVRTTQPGVRRPLLGKARWLERSGPVQSWADLRRRALGRLTAQASALGASAVVGIRAERRESNVVAPPMIEVAFTGTAVRLRDGLVSGGAPVLTLASAQELALLVRAGIEPAGIAGGSSNVEVWPSNETVALAARRRRRRNAELTDLTTGVYEARRLAMTRVMAEAQSLHADGVIGIDMTSEHHAEGFSLALRIGVHVLATAVRRQGTGLAAVPILNLGERASG